MSAGLLLQFFSDTSSEILLLANSSPEILHFEILPCAHKYCFYLRQVPLACFL